MPLPAQFTVKFKTKITKARFTYSPFTPEEMKSIGDEIIRLNFERWDKAIDANDQPAPPLKEGYKARKMRKTGRSVRDLYGPVGRGRLRRSIHVLQVNQNRGTIGCDAGIHTPSIKGRPSLTFDDVLNINQRKARMFAMSPRDREMWLRYVRGQRNIAGVAAVA